MVTSFNSVGFSEGFLSSVFDVSCAKVKAVANKHKGILSDFMDVD
jgi:hypothetical protein